MLLGAGIGIGAYTFIYARAYTYLSSDPEVCANCHIMQSQYASWQEASHHHVAICNDCHLPHDFIRKYFAKALNGFNHAKAYTLQNYGEPLAIKAFNSAILQESCLACHRPMVQDIVAAAGGEEVSCVHCHQSAGHGERAGMGGPLPRTRRTTT